MSLTDLPEEILVIIIKKLDLKSVYNVYKTSNHMKYIVCSNVVVKTGSLALSTMATVQTFKLKFFKDIACHLQNLDVRGVNDLNRTALLTAVKRMTCLKSLDVSYTNITITDLIEIHKMCPTLRNLTCNFVFSKENATKIKKSVLIESQNLFQNFDNIHFVGNGNNILNHNLIMLILCKAHLHHLQLTVAENHSTVYEQIEEMNLKVDLKVISIYVLSECKLNYLGFGSIAYIPRLWTSKDSYEFIVIIDYDEFIIYVSPIFKNFFYDHFKLDSKCVKNIDFLHNVANAVVILWNKSEILFNDFFFSELKNKFINIFPYNIKDNITVGPENIDKFICRISPPQTTSNTFLLQTSDFKTKRLGASPCVLNYDAVFSKKDKVKLILSFHDCLNYPVALSSNNQYLRKLTFLCLSGNVRYNADFFNVIFRYCDQLQTINIEAPVSSPSGLSIIRNIVLSNSLKNFRLVDRKIDFRMLFSSLSQCCTLENIHITDLSQDDNEPISQIMRWERVPGTLFEKCENLYSLFILATMSPTAKSRCSSMLKKLKAKFNKNHLNLTLCSKITECKYTYDPYIDVFRLSPIIQKPLIC